MDVWGKLKHFSKSENWGDPEKMDPEFLIQLDDFRHVIDKPCVLTCAAFANQGHSDQSYHYKGRAADVRFIDPTTREPLTLREHIFIAMKAPFGGVGIYTWSAMGPFLHLDNRVAEYERKIWVSKKEGQYENLSVEFLERSFGSYL
jgi:uncharacterized protein YcbK (DUF882 family)